MRTTTNFVEAKNYFCNTITFLEYQQYPISFQRMYRILLSFVTI